MTDHTVDELALLIDLLPPRLRDAVRTYIGGNDLVEIVMDLGRHPEVRSHDGSAVFEDIEITAEDIAVVVDRIGDFGGDNRAGIARTLHRISALRNRRGDIIGLTLRAGRAVQGAAEIVRDVIESGQSVLIVGRPGVGKTTLLRETARILAQHKRVVIVDTSNEIAGDGDIPHAAIGRARRMQVPEPALQHEVMIEAVENHNPEVIVIDEIGRELEAQAARTIAERGVQLIGTAHGNVLENLIMNPTLSDLVGGVESVTLSDEEARRRGTQKSVLERRAPPTFDIALEIQDWHRVTIHPSVGSAVDALLRGRVLAPELRYMDDDGQVVVEAGTPLPPPVEQRTALRGALAGRASADGPAWPRPGRAVREERERAGDGAHGPGAHPGAHPEAPPHQLRRIFAYGVSQSRLRQSAKALAVPLALVDELSEADALITLKSYYRKRPIVISDAEVQGVPTYVLRSNTFGQIEQVLAELYGLQPAVDPDEAVMRETHDAIQVIRSGRREFIDLAPANAFVRRQQHDLAREANLASLSRGKDPHRRVRISRAGA
ncbi:MAG: R3H domain-containing nucleic acid-binding protein [Ardenticatenales bacterium]